MPNILDFSLSRGEDVTISISLAPPTPVGGQQFQFNVTKRFGGTSGLITKTITSGFSGLSGVAVTNSGQGAFAVTINNGDTSSLEYGNYAYQFSRLTSGQVTVASEGYMLVQP